jgi:recombination protein RecA
LFYLFTEMSALFSMHPQFDVKDTNGEYKANMPSAALIRSQIEASLSKRIPSALTPSPRIVRCVTTTGIPSIDAVLDGGLPLGAITEVVGPECSGRTAFALSFVAGLTQSARVCAWVDVSDTLHPESAAASGVDLARLLWVRCGVSSAAYGESHSQHTFSLPEKFLAPPPIKKGLHGGGFGSHPRNEAKGLSDSISGFMRPEMFAPRCAEPQRRVQSQREIFKPAPSRGTATLGRKTAQAPKPWTRIEQALRVIDLLLQGGGFSAIVLDMGSIAPEFATRVPLATWFRYRAAAERTRTSILLLTQYSCAKSSVELLLRFKPGDALREEATVFTGIEHCVEVARQRYTPASTNVIALRKPPHKADTAYWKGRTTWTGTQ